MGCTCEETTVDSYKDDCNFLTAAYILAGLSMMLNIRLAYSSAPYALIRFQLPENLFSVFVRRMASALEFWCLPSMLLGNIIEIAQRVTAEPKKEFQLTTSGAQDDENDKKLGKLIVMKRHKYRYIIIPSMVTMWSDFITYLVLLTVYVMGDQGHVTAYYFVIAISGFIFGINMVLVYAADWRYIPVYIAGENSFPMLTSIIHYFTTLIFGNRRKYNSDFLIVCIDISVAIIISFVTAIMWTYSYEMLNHGEGNDDKKIKFGVSGAGAGTARKIDSTHKSKIEAGIGIKENHYLADEEYFTKYWHLLPSDRYDPSDLPDGTVASPALMVIIGMGFVYCIYPGIAPGMIVPFYLVDKIETVLLVLTTFPPVIIAILQKLESTKPYSPKTTIRQGSGLGGWTKYTFKFGGEYDTTFYHGFDILMIIKMTLLVIFIYCLHYRDSHISRSIVNQPKMSTFLTIVFYMCHEFLLALGFAGVIGNNGATYVVLPAQYVGALFMIFLAFYSEGYIIEYKSHDPQHWPTEVMTPWKVFCYWTMSASKITNYNMMSLFKNYLSRGLALFNNFLYLIVYIFIIV